MMQVRFNNPEEFCAELELEAREKHVRGDIVRVTNMITGASASGIWELQVVAAFEACGEVVCLEYHCGTLWGSSQDNEVIDKAAKVKVLVREKADRLGLEIRGGTIEDARRRQ